MEAPGNMIRWAVPLAVCLAFAVAAPAQAGDFIDCSNTADDDRDGLIDRADPGCESDRDDTENAITATLAHAAAGRLLDLFYPSVRRVVSCRKAGSRYRCRFRLRQKKSFRYKGVVSAYDRELSGGGGQVRFARLKVIRGTCGRIGRSGPLAIRVRNVSCTSARHDIRAWYYRNRPFPYNCLLRPVPNTARCSYQGRKLSFKYRVR